MTRSLANYLASVAEDAQQRRRLSNARRHLERGNILVTEDENQAIITEFLQAIQDFIQAAAYNPRLTPQLADAHFKLGSAYDKMGQRKEAVDNFVETLLRDPSLTPQVALSHYNRRRRPTPQETVPRPSMITPRRGTAVDKAGEPQAVIDEYALALVLNPQLADAHHSWGVRPARIGPGGISYDGLLGNGVPESPTPSGLLL